TRIAKLEAELAAKEKAPAEAKKKPGIVGVWRLVKGDKGEVSELTLQYAADGSLKVTGKDRAAFLLDGIYSIEGTNLTITFEVPGTPPITTRDQIKKLTDTELVIQDEKGKVEEYRRLGM